MRYVLFMICAFVAAVAACAADSATPATRILLTGYGPFMGRGVNGSQTVATSFSATSVPGVELRVEIMKVEWGEPERIVREVIATWKPDVVIGLGEGHAFVGIERIGRNQREGADEAGRQPPTALIELAGPATRAATLLPIPSMQSLRTTVPVRMSRNAGAFLCNDALYRFCGSAATRAGFVHLPPQGTTSNEQYLRQLRPIVEHIIVSQRSP